MKSLSVPAAVFAAALLLTQTGCASDCDKIRKQYEEALAAEPQMLEQVPADGPVQLGVVIRDRVLDEVVDTALRSGLTKALAFSDKVSLATGQSVGLKANADVAKLGLHADASCEECMRIDGRLGGDVEIRLPLLGIQKVPLTGSMTLVAPVVLETTNDGRGAVKLDLAKVAQVGKSHVDPEVTQLPPTWWKVIQKPLSNMMLEAVTKNLAPVTLFTFAAPDLGVDGLRVAPARVVTNAKRGTVFVGFRTNLPAASASELAPLTELAAVDDIAVGVESGSATSFANALLTSGKLSRRWTADGKSDPNGPIHVTLREVTVRPGNADVAPFDVKFRAWRIADSGKCWWSDVDATGKVTVADGMQMTAEIESASIVESSLAGVFEPVANWVTSEFLLRTARVVTKSLDHEGTSFPGGKIDLTKGRLSSDGSAVWFKASTKVTSADDEEGGDDEEESDE